MTNLGAGDYPQITSSGYGTSTVGWWPEQTTDGTEPWKVQLDDLKRSLERRPQQFTVHKPQLEIIEPMSTRRIVKVFIADPHPDVPMDKALLYKGEEKWTDATNEELYFEIPVNDLLKAHNAERVKWLDKEASKKAGKDILLEPVRIRDLKMVVVEIAKF